MGGQRSSPSYGVVAHFLFDASGLSLAAAGDDAFLQNLIENHSTEPFTVIRRGEKRRGSVSGGG